MNKVVYKIKPLFVLFFILVLSFLIYLPGLSGDYVFDDIANIIENQKIAITSLDYSSLKAAFWSGDAGPLGRPISMLSFAINYYFTGFEPYFFKLTNLIIHLMNGIILYFISLKLFENIDFNNEEVNKNKYLALMVSVIWLIHPLNLTSVLYVVQRMTSLSTLFGLLALLIYFTWRSKPLNLSNSIVPLVGVFLALCCSVFSKESGLLFVGLIYWVELCIFKTNNFEKKPIVLFGVKLNYILWLGVVFAIFALIYISLPFVGNPNLGGRDFNTIERLYSETRVIFYYLKMIFFPLLSDLSLYHDDFEISKNIITPITTLYSIVGIFLISIFSLFLFKKLPLVLFAWGWFIISHLMESTFISLELIHEHRNYFASMGFIIAVVYGLSKFKFNKVRPLIYIVCAVYIMNLAFTTWQRAVIWSNLVDHAAFEVEMHPTSDRANYQMARVYLKLMEKEPEKKAYYANQAEKYLLQAHESYKPANGSWFAQLHLASYLDKPISEGIIQQLIYNLKNHPFYNSNIGFLNAFIQCQIQQNCKVPHDQAILIIVAGLSNPNAGSEMKAEIYKLLAQYFISVAADYKKGEEFMYDALKYKNDVNGNLLLAQIYRMQGNYTFARKYVQIAKELDVRHGWYKEISIENRNIEHAELLGNKK
ncbi:hypothetical protein HXZ77_00900 [Acinetobacter johnsonii]|uniref:tetratricopeptide repeat protein n=1 Tax=Acinetobacter johnsonii TaxID=40214 RepID=UPI002576D6D8|nr:hypothetical protein [Acinetobacter johnsonii]MDM1249714.1 hypothetical protein [Acinetobacter johnsonii]